MNTLNISSAPHVLTKRTTQKIMLDVIIALVPAIIASVVFFGFYSLLMIVTSVLTCVITEFLYNKIIKKETTINDLSAVVTGIILALNLNSNVKIYQIVIGSIFAILVVKCFFGGLGKNIVNPAVAARVFMLLSFANMASVSNPIIGDVTTSSTPLISLQNNSNEISIFNLFLGLHAGSIGETCIIALLLGFVYLVIRKVIKWYIPFTFVCTTFLCFIIYSGDFIYSVSQIFAGGLFFGAIFMATDYVTTPYNNLGRIIFCIGCGLITFYIRQFSQYPEGVTSAILCMNLLVPLIEKWTTPKTLGGVK